MSNKDYGRSVNLLCPTCGGDQFEYDGEEAAFFTCTSCQREIAKDDLIDENSENIHVNASEVIEEVKKDFEKQIRDMFKYNKFIKIK